MQIGCCGPKGLFLRTQHFQQQDRFFETVARGTLQAARLQTFGFRSLTLDPSLLESGQVAILSARGILPGRHAVCDPRNNGCTEAAVDHAGHRRRCGTNRAAA